MSADDLDAAVRHFREAQEAIALAEAKVQEAKDYVPVARAKLAEAMVRAARNGMRQKEIIERTGYTRESVRRILRLGGFDPSSE